MEGSSGAAPLEGLPWCGSPGGVRLWGTLEWVAWSGPLYVFTWRGRFLQEFP